MEYNHKSIESRWQQYWRDNNVYKAEINGSDSTTASVTRGFALNAQYL